MSTPYVALNGEQIASLELTIPYTGLWVADVGTAIDAELADAVTISIGALSLVGHVARTAGYAGSRSARIVGGFGGWRKDVEPRVYRSDSGVKLSHVLFDAATEVGEKVSIQTDRSIGTSYVRCEGPASDVLLQLVGESGWYVQTDGTTRVGARASSSITTPFQVIGYVGGKGRLEIATENPEDWMPGRSFTAPTVPTPQTIRSVTHRVDSEGRARLDVLTIESPLLALVRAAFPNLRYLGRFAYRVQGVTGRLVDVVPDDATLGLPSIPKCPLVSSIIGERVHPLTGSLVLVEFLGGDPTRGVITGGDWENPPDNIKLGGGGAGVARVDDNVNAGYLVVVTATGGIDGVGWLGPSPPASPGYFPGTAAGLAAANARQTALSGSGTPCYVLKMEHAKIDEGSSIVESG